MPPEPPEPPADTFLAALMADVLEAARAADILTRKANPDGSFLEFALLPDRLELRIPVAADANGTITLPKRRHRATGEAVVRWRRLQTPESVRAEIDDTNEIDGLIRDHNRQANLEARHDRNPPRDEAPHSS